MLIPKRIAPPATPIITLDEVKQHCRIDLDFDGDDALLTAYIAAIESKLDGYSGILGRCLITQTWRYSLSCWPGCKLTLPFPDTESVVVTYFDTQNVQQTLPDTQYQVLEGAGGSFLRWFDSFSSPSLYDRGDAVQIDMTCGYGTTPASVPAVIIHAAKLIIGAWYESRENATIGVAVSDLPMSISAKALLGPVTRVGV